MKNWKILSSKNVLKNKFFNVRRDKCLTAQSKVIDEFYVKEERGAVIVLAITSDKKVILVEQYRHGTRKVSLDLPGGGVKGGESSRKAAQREFLEETGYEAKKLIPIRKLACNPSWNQEYLHIFLGQELIKRDGQQNSEPGEEIKLHFVPLDKIEGYIKDKKIDCTLCISGIYLVLKFLKRKHEN